MATYRVNKGGTLLITSPSGVSVMLPEGLRFKSGQEIEVGGRLYPCPKQKRLDEFVRDGYISPIEYELKEDPNKPFTEHIPGVDESKSLKLPGSGKTADDAKMPHEVIHTSEGMSIKVPEGGVQTHTSNPVQPPVTQQESIWDVDPATLDGIDIESLNVMILEKGGEPVDSVEEAIAALSKDFKTKE